MLYSIAEARSIVTNILNDGVNADEDDGLLIVDEKTVERDWGWVFFYFSVRFLRTHDPRLEPVGAGPVFFNRYTGEIRRFGSGGELNHEVYDYEMELQAKDGIWCLWLSAGQERKQTVVKLKVALDITTREAMDMVPALPACLFAGFRRELDWVARQMSKFGILTYFTVEASRESAFSNFCDPGGGLARSLAEAYHNRRNV